MFDHVTLRASDRAATERFYATVLPALGCEEQHAGGPSTLFGNFELSVTQASAERPVTEHVHIGLRAPAPSMIDAFWQAGIDAGFTDDGAPGPRPQYGDDYRGAFLLDPDGNSIEAAGHDNLRPRGLIDHVWLRTAELDAARDFYLAVAPHAGWNVRADEPELLRLRGPHGGTLTIAAGAAATRGVHLAFPAERAAVDAFHAALTAAGYRSDGAPGPRPYHPSYYGAFVLDPGGNSVELVDHGGLLGERH